MDGLDLDYPLSVGMYGDARHIGLVLYRDGFEDSGVVKVDLLASGQEVVPNPTELSVMHAGPFKSGTRPRQLHD